MSNYILKSARPSLPRYTLNVKDAKKTIMKRSKAACLRCNIPNILLREEQHYFSFLYLFLPFKDEIEILIPYKSYKEAFIHKRHLLNHDQLQKTNLIEKFEKTVQHLLTLDDNALHALHSTTTPSFQQIQNVANEEGIQHVNNLFAMDIISE